MEAENGMRCMNLTSGTNFQPSQEMHIGRPRTATILNWTKMRKALVFFVSAASPVCLRLDRRRSALILCKTFVGSLRVQYYFASESPTFGP